MGRPTTPPVLLSVVPSEDQLNPKAPPPKYYTVSEFLNTIIRHNIELPDDGLPQVSSGASVTCTRGSGSASTDSPAESVKNDDPSPTRKRARRIGEGVSTKAYIDTPPKHIIMRDAYLDVDELWSETKDDPLLQHQPWLRQIANPFSKVIRSNWGTPRLTFPIVRKRYSGEDAYTHPDGTPFTYEEELNRLMNPNPRRKIQDILTENKKKAGVSPMFREAAMADLEDMLRTLEIPSYQEAIYKEHDSASDNWQALFEDSALERVKTVREKHANQRAERVQREHEKRERELAAVLQKREVCKKYFKNVEEAISKNPLGWFEGKPAAKDFPRFLEMPPHAMTAFMCTVLSVPGEELVPYHYVAGKVVKNPDGTRRGLRNKPRMEVLVALSAVHHKDVRKTLDAARNVL